MLRRSFSKADEGLALVVALVITLVVFILTTAILADAFHNVVTATQARQRLTAIDAAEAGIAWYARNLEIASPTALTSGSWVASGSAYTLSGSVRGLPAGGKYSLEVRYFSDSGLSTTAPMASYTATSIPQVIWARVDAKGQQMTASGATVGPTRTVRVVFELRPTIASISGSYAGLFICQLGNRFTITGENADLYLIGSAAGSGGCPTDSLIVSSGQFTTSGSVYVVNGDVSLTNTSLIAGSLWAKKNVTLGSGGGGGGGGGATSCAGTNSASVLVCQNVTSVLSEPSVVGTARVLGTVGQCGACVLPNLSFPQIVWNAANWSGYATATSWSDTYLPATASAASSTPRVVHISGCAGPQAMPSGTRYLGASLAVVSDCGFTFSQRVSIQNAAAGTSRPTLYLITTWDSAWTGSEPSCGALTTKDISISNQFNSTAVNAFIYTPCLLSLANKVSITGQLTSRTLLPTGQTTINTVQVVGAPGSAQPGYVSGFAARVLDSREV